MTSNTSHSGMSRELNGCTRGCSAHLDLGKEGARGADPLGQEWVQNLTCLLALSFPDCWLTQSLWDATEEIMAYQPFFYLFIYFLNTNYSGWHLPRFIYVNLVKRLQQNFFHTQTSPGINQSISLPAWKKKKACCLRTSWCVFFHLIFGLNFLLDKSPGSRTYADRLFPSQCLSRCNSFSYLRCVMFH